MADVGHQVLAADTCEALLIHPAKMAGAHTWSQDSLADSLGGCNLSGRGLRAQRFEAKIATGFPCSEAPALEREGHDGRILLDKKVVVAEALDYANHVGGQAPQTVPSQATSRPFGPRGSMQMPMQDCQQTQQSQRELRQLKQSRSVLVCLAIVCVPRS